MPSVVTTWEILMALISVFSALLAVPMTVLIFHLRTLRSDQQAKHQEMDRWSEWMQREVTEIRRGIHRMPGDYVGKEEWLRETMRIRQAVERLSDGLARQEVRLENMTEWWPHHGEAKAISRRIESDREEVGGAEVRRSMVGSETDSPRREACS